MNFTLATLEDIEHAGYYRGRNIASWCDLPELGKEYRWPDDLRPRLVETDDDARDLVTATAFACEEENRSFSPFEFMACEINNRDDDADEAWEAFDRGISRGIDEEVAARFARAAKNANCL